MIDVIINIVIEYVDKECFEPLPEKDIFSAQIIDMDMGIDISTGICVNTGIDMNTQIHRGSDFKLSEECWNRLCKNTASWVAPILASNIKTAYGIRPMGILCGNPAPWVEPMIQANLSELDANGWWSLCGNPAPWVEPIIRTSDHLNKHALKNNESLWACKLCIDLKCAAKFHKDRWNKWLLYKSRIIDTLLKF